MASTLLATAGYPKSYRWVVFRVVSLLIAGSIATDHLMSFKGLFADSLVVEQLDKLSVSFLVDDLDVRRGGCAANICFGLGNLGLRAGAGRRGRGGLRRVPLLAASGTASTATPSTSRETRHTARFVCTTDSADAQIASFYPGAMSEAREIELKPIVDRVGAPDFVLVGPDDPEGMLRHTEECRQRGYPFVADPQPAARLRRRRHDPAAGRRRRTSWSATSTSRR